MTFPQFLAHLALGLIFVFAFIFALHLVVIVCVSALYFFSGHGTDPFHNPLKVFGFCTAVVLLLVPTMLALKRGYSRLAALTLRNDGLPPPLPR